MTTPVSRPRAGRSFGRRRSNVRRNWSRVVHLMMVAVTVAIIVTTFLVIAIWIVPMVMTQAAEAADVQSGAETAVAASKQPQGDAPTAAAEMAAISTPEWTSTTEPTPEPTAEPTVEPTVEPTPVPEVPAPVPAAPAPAAAAETASVTEPSLPPAQVSEVLCTVLPGADNTMIYLRSAPYLELNAVRTLGTLERGIQPRILSQHTNADGLFFKVRAPDGVVGWVPAALCITQVGVLGTLVPLELAVDVPTRAPMVTSQVQLGGSRQPPPVVSHEESAPPGLFVPSVSISCSPGDGRTWFEGYVWVDGHPASGYRVWFASRFGGDSWSQLSGPHEGYWGWAAGYYAHIVDDPRQAYVKHLKVWVTDSAGRRVSTDAEWDTDCSYARIDFRLP